MKVVLNKIFYTIIWYKLDHFTITRQLSTKQFDCETHGVQEVPILCLNEQEPLPL